MTTLILICALPIVLVIGYIIGYNHGFGRAGAKCLAEYEATWVSPGEKGLRKPLSPSKVAEWVQSTIRGFEKNWAEATTLDVMARALDKLMFNLHQLVLEIKIPR